MIRIAQLLRQAWRRSYVGVSSGRKVLALSGIVILSTVICCDERPPVVDQYESIPGREWTYEFRPEVLLRVEDPGQPYRLLVNLRHSQHYRYSNIYLLLRQQAVLNNGLAAAPPEQIERVEVVLAEPDGRWLGRQSGNLYSHRVVAVDQHLFPDTGWYKISLEQNMRDDPLSGVVSAGLRIELVAP